MWYPYWVDTNFKYNLIISHGERKKINKNVIKRKQLAYTTYSDIKTYK